MPSRRETADGDGAALEEIRQIVHARPELFARQGKVVAAWRTRDGRKSGPYYRLVYRDQGRQRPIYLGRSEALAEEVRRLLASLQQ